MKDAILICITGYIDTRLRERARQAGCDHILTKSAEWPELLAAIARLLKKQEVNWA